MNSPGSYGSCKDVKLFPASDSYHEQVEGKLVMIMVTQYTRWKKGVGTAAFVRSRRNVAHTRRNVTRIKRRDGQNVFPQFRFKIISPAKISIMEYSVAAYGLGYEVSIKKKKCVLCDDYVYYYWNEITTCHLVNGAKLGKLGHFLDGGMIGQCLLTLTFFFFCKNP